MKNERLFGALAGIGLALSGCMTLKPVGSIDLAYIPSRVDDKFVSNEWMTDLNLGLELKVVDGPIKDASLTVGGAQRTFMNWIKINPSIGEQEALGFHPTRQEYDFYMELAYQNFKLYASHMCSHPVNEIEYYPIFQGEQWVLNHEDITKIGVKFEL